MARIGIIGGGWWWISAVFVAIIGLKYDVEKLDSVMNSGP